MESLTLTTQDIDLILEGTFLYSFAGVLAALFFYDLLNAFFLSLGKSAWRAFKK
ncbi:hypothetical protein H320_06050 [Vibrio parahaemolyticus 49]|nr:hypothetical protein H320_06050 [Vibrio parahaemolyticus 49]